MSANIKKYESIAREVRRDIVEMHFNAEASHVASSLSCVDLLVVLYFSVLRLSRDEEGDRFILSKGHAASALYAVLSKKGFFDKAVLNKYCCNGGILPGHATRHCVPGVEVSTGSLGHGLSIGAGMAVADKYDKRRGRIFVLMSDGECDEGSVWESALFAGHHRLNNLVAIIDYNKIQAFGHTREVLDLEPFTDKWKAFGFSVREIDGHDFKKMKTALKSVPFETNKPSVIIAHTVKGKGVSFMENKLLWHYKSPGKNDLEMALRELA